MHPSNGYSFEWIISGLTIFFSYFLCHSPLGVSVCSYSSLSLHIFLLQSLFCSLFSFLLRRIRFLPILRSLSLSLSLFLSFIRTLLAFLIKAKQTATQPQLFCHINWKISFESRRLQAAWLNWNRFMCFYSATAFGIVCFHQCQRNSVKKESESEVQIFISSRPPGVAVANFKNQIYTL